MFLLASVLGTGSLAGKIPKDVPAGILIEDPLSFGTTKREERHLANLKQLDALVEDLTDIPIADFTSCRAFDDMISDTLAVNRKVFLDSQQPNLNSSLDKQGVFKKLELDSILSERSTVLSCGTFHRPGASAMQIHPIDLIFTRNKLK